MSVLLDLIYAAVILGVFWHLCVAFSLIGCKWAFLIPYELLPDYLKGQHGDWWLAKRIPRSFTAFLSTKDPVKWLGTAPADGHLDIPPLGTWCLCWPLYFVRRSNNGWLTRAGARRTYMDDPKQSYYQWPSFTPLKRQL